MKWIIDNWSLLIVILAGVVIVGMYIKKFIDMPSDEQIEKVREWLLYAVIEAEKQFQGGTGQIKLRYVYDMFVTKFPTLVSIISFELFSDLVDDALEQMRHLLETNANIADYVGIIERIK